MDQHMSTKPGIGTVDAIDSVRDSLEGLSTIAMSLAASDMADKQALYMLSEKLSSCANTLCEVSTDVNTLVQESRERAEAASHSPATPPAEQGAAACADRSHTTADDPFAQKDARRAARATQPRLEYAWISVP